MATTAVSKPEEWFGIGRYAEWPHFGSCRSARRRIRDSRRNSRTEDIILRAAIASPRESTMSDRVGHAKVQRRVTPWRELTRDCSLRPGGASLLAKTGRSEQGGD
jgi:hypothetical protein